MDYKVHSGLWIAWIDYKIKQLLWTKWKFLEYIFIITLSIIIIHQRRYTNYQTLFAYLGCKWEAVSNVRDTTSHDENYCATDEQTWINRLLCFNACMEINVLWRSVGPTNLNSL